MKVTEFDLFGFTKKGFYIVKMKVAFKTKKSPITYLEDRAFIAFFFNKTFIYVHFCFKTKRIDF